jgi:hypothetical protein
VVSRKLFFAVSDRVRSNPTQRRWPSGGGPPCDKVGAHQECRIAPDNDRTDRRPDIPDRTRRY